MNAVRLVCAYAALERARGIARLLGAENFDVRLAAGRPSLAEIGDPERADEKLLVAWCHDGVSSPYVHRWIQAHAGRPLIELSLDGDYGAIDGSIPGLSQRTQAPIDFRDWRDGDRGAGAWKELERRMRRAFYVAPDNRPSMAAAAAFGAVVTIALTAAVSIRMLNGDAAQTASAAPVDQTAARVLVGGPELRGAADAIPPEEELVLEADVIRAFPIRDAPQAPALLAPQFAPRFDPD